MKRLFLFVLLLWMASPASSSAQLLNGGLPSGSRVGVGFDVDLNGFSIRFGDIKGVRFDINFGLGIDANLSGNSSVRLDLTPGFRVLFPISSFKMIQMHVVAGAYFLFKPDSSRFSMDLSLFAGFLPEIFIVERLSIEIMIGLAFNVNNIGTDAVQISIGTLGKGISFLSGAAFHWYF